MRAPAFAALAAASLPLLAGCATGPTSGPQLAAREEMLSYCFRRFVDPELNTPTTRTMDMSVKNVGKPCWITMSPMMRAARSSSIDDLPANGGAFVENNPDGLSTKIGYLPDPGFTGKDRMVVTVASPGFKSTITFRITVQN
jgi:hypothetical protein